MCTDFTGVVQAKAEASRSRWLYPDILENGMILHDIEGFFAGVLDSPRGNLERLGARRLRLRDVRWWDLKPAVRSAQESVELAAEAICRAETVLEACSILKTGE